MEDNNYINLSEFNYSQAKNAEVLKKISFFLSNDKINPYEYKVNPSTGNFINIETNEIIEIKKGKEDTYEIVNNNPNSKETKEETSEKENTVDKKDIKIRRLTKSKEESKPNNAAFVSNSFIIVVFTIFALIIGLVLSQFFQ